MAMKPRPSRITCRLCGYSTIFSPNSDRIYYPPCPSCGQREAKWDHATLSVLDHMHTKILFPQLFK